MIENLGAVVKKILMKLILPVGGGALVAGGVVILVSMTKEEAYRQIQIYKVEGTADVEREQTGTIEVYANMMLQTQDIVNVSKESNLQLKLDEDKYILLEPQTKISLEATGNSVNSKTKILLHEGAIVCNIENKLSEKSSFQVNAPNATMAVRGTTFRVAVEYDKDGNSYTVVSVFDGQVESFLIYPNGEIDTEGILIPTGTQVWVKGTEKDSMYLFKNQEISYDELKEITLEFLQILLEKGEKLSITEEEIEALLEELRKTDDEEETEEIELEETEMEETEIEETEIEEMKSGEIETEKQETGTETTDSQRSETEDSSASDGNANDVSGSSDNNVQTGDTTTDTTTDADTENGTFTVNFTYNGATFATQTVKSGECAAEPTLMPTAAGNWDFDFTNNITADTTINWVDSAGE